MHLARLDRQVDALEDFLALDRHVQVFNFQHSFFVLLHSLYLVILNLIQDP
jgi:hypothetical protein